MVNKLKHHCQSIILSHSRSIPYVVISPHAKSGRFSCNLRQVLGRISALERVEQKGLFAQKGPTAPCGHCKDEQKGISP